MEYHNKNAHRPDDLHAPTRTTSKIACGLGQTFLTKEELRGALNLPSTRMVDELVRRRKIPVIRLGYRTLRFDLAKVILAVERLELKAVGQK